MTDLVRRPAIAALILLVVYIVASFANDTRGTLGTDTGGKVATLEVMHDRGRLDPDVGYWAERWDPDGSLHPLYNTVRVGDRWVQVTTLPVLYAAHPLYHLGGYRLALLLPMAGSVLAALAARALARRLGSSDGTAAFWIAGLASPLAIYALDFWEHSLGVALIAWAAVVVVDLIRGAPWWRGALAGALLGGAAAMRTEALVYAAVLTGAAAIVVVLARDLRRAVAVSAAISVGVVALVGANAALENATLGSTLRVGRAAGAAVSASGESDVSRLDEALVTLASPVASVDRAAEVAGLLLLAVLLALVVLADERRRPAFPARAAGALAAALYAGRLAGGPDFVPGMVAAAPLAVAGAVYGWGTRAGRALLGAALAALPVVWVFQFTGGAAPQWGGRYILPTGFLLTVAGVAALPRLTRWARIELVALSVAVTLLGVAWLSVRSHAVGDAGATLARRPEPVLVSRVSHLVRELAVTYDDKRWLTTPPSGDLTEAAALVRSAGFPTFATVDLAGSSAPREVGGFRAGASTRVAFLPKNDLVVTIYRD